MSRLTHDEWLGLTLVRIEQPDAYDDAVERLRDSLIVRSVGDLRRHVKRDGVLVAEQAEHIDRIGEVEREASNASRRRLAAATGTRSSEWGVAR